MSKQEEKVISLVQTALLLVLVVYAAFWMAKLTWWVMAPQEGAPVILPAKASNVTQKQSGYASQIPRYHLFGEAGKKPVVKREEVKEAPKTRLRLVLKGVFTSTQPENAGAIIEELGKSADYYGVGDTLPGNATLEEVLADRVLLRRNGRLETLAFAEESKSKTGQSIAKVTSPVVKPTRVTKKEEVVETPEQFISEATQRLAEDPEKALGSVGLKASDGGYVYQGGNPMLAGLNLKKGDVIRSVNGHSLGDVQKDKQLMQSLYEQGSLEVEIERDGASFFINYPLR